MISKLPLMFVAVSLYNYCYSKNCKKCKYYLNSSPYFNRITCRSFDCLQEIIITYSKFCEEHYSCKDCNLSANDINCYVHNLALELSKRKFVVEK